MGDIDTLEDKAAQPTSQVPEGSLAPPPTDTSEDDESDASEPQPSSTGEIDSGGSEGTPDHRFALSLIGFDGVPIEGLKCKVCIDAATWEFVTDSEGKLPPVCHLPGQDLRIWVARDDGSYKQIVKALTEPGQLSYSLISPAFVVRTSTEPHEGPPGEAAASIPKPESQAESKSEQHDGRRAQDKNPAKHVTAHASSSAPSKPASGPQGTFSSPARAPMPSTTGAKQTLAPQPGRDEAGSPYAVVTQKVKDWWGRWRMPTLNLWSWLDFSQGTSRPQQAHLNRAIPSQPAPQSADALARMQLLLSLAETHVTWTINEDTSTALAAMARQEFRQHGNEKAANTALGFCAKYVKINLMLSGIVRAGLLTFGSGSEGGPQLLANGFTDVTDRLPDARWAAPGDVLVYRWSEATWSARRRSARWHGSAQHPNMSLPNHGHIDIRSYDTYLSDFAPASNHPTWAEYDEPRIYRSAYYDPLPEIRMRAFLRCLRDFECQGEPDDRKRYGMLHTPLPHSTTRRFSDFSVHPWHAVPEGERGSATASGAYQIVYTTWRYLLTGKDKQGTVDTRAVQIQLAPNAASFTPQVQDRMAVALIDSRHALGAVRRGDLDAAVKLLRSEWTSLPGASQNAARRSADGKPMNMAYLEGLFSAYVNDLKRGSSR